MDGSKKARLTEQVRRFRARFAQHAQGALPLGEVIPRRWLIERIEEAIGHVAAPTFFWGGHAARATGRFIAVHLILMGVWRDSFAAMS